VVLLALIVYAIYKLAKFYWMWWLDSTLMFYSVKSNKEPPASPAPFEFAHEGKRYKVFATHDEVKNEMRGTKMSRSYVYIDDKLVLMISRMQALVFIRRSIDVDLQYANTDIFKILKWARIHWQRQFSEEYKRHTEGTGLIQN